MPVAPKGTAKITQTLHVVGCLVLDQQWSRAQLPSSRAVPVEQVSESRLGDLKKETTQLEEELEQTR